MLVLIVLFFPILANKDILVVFLKILFIASLSLVNINIVNFESRQGLTRSQGALITVNHRLIGEVFIDGELIVLRKLCWGFIIVVHVG